jgi:hypothetical protein
MLMKFCATWYQCKQVTSYWGDNAIQPSKDPLEVPVGPVTRLRTKKFKQAFNGLLQDTWAKVDFKRICNNKEQALCCSFQPSLNIDRTDLLSNQRGKRY